MLQVENNSSTEVESGYRQHKFPCVFDFLIEVVKRRLFVLLSLFEIGSPLSVVVEVDCLRGLNRSVSLDMFSVHFAVG